MLNSWLSLMRAWDFPPKMHVFHLLEERYKQRAYHNLDHISHMLALAAADHASKNIQLAIWFHDVLDSEEDSALFAELFCGSETVGALVRATAHKKRGFTLGERMIQDYDLDCLSWEWNNYLLDYAEKVWDEYKDRVTRKVFCVNRVEILREFLLRDTIYNEEPWEGAEKQARANMEREIRMLEGTETYQKYGYTYTSKGNRVYE